MNINFEALEDKTSISTFQTAWQNSLTFPYDGSYVAEFNSSQHWLVKHKEERIGYACVSDKNLLYNFYIEPKYLKNGAAILEEFVKQREIKEAEVDTNNPICLSMVMELQKSIAVESYLFKDMEEVIPEERDVAFRLARTDELDRMLNFHQEAYEIAELSEKATEGLSDYYGNCLSTAVIYFLEKDKEVIGILEVRTADTGTKPTSLGVVVLPNYRKKGYGSYMLCQGKLIAKSRDSEAICSCNVKNISSRKAIEKSGFRALHLTLLINL